MPVREEGRARPGPFKKRRVSHDDENVQYFAPRHPCNAKPSGNGLLANDNIRSSSLGHLGALTDEVLLQIIALLEARDWVSLESVSQMLRAFALHEGHWKDAAIHLTGGNLGTWNGSWKATYLGHCQPDAAPKQSLARAKVKAQGIYSDALYMPLHLACCSLSKYIPKGKKRRRSLDRLRASACNRDEFFDKYIQSGKPCLIVEDGGGSQLPRWTIQDMRTMFPDRRIRSEALTMSMSCYARYAADCQQAQEDPLDWIPDESPFYLFDATLAQSLQREGKWVVPALFQEEASSDLSTMRADWDLFSLLAGRRPDHAWVIAGPRRSGSGWHVDPNCTSAYNAVLSGRKLWMLLPPDVTPPGVYISEDGGTVTAPLSIMEWLINFYEECIRKHGIHGDNRLIIDICAAGETIFIPAGWKHLVLNLDESVAFTRNFITPAELPALLDFMQRTPEQMSGFRLNARRKKLSGTTSTEEDGLSETELDDLVDDGIAEKKAIATAFTDRLADTEPDLLASAQIGLQELVEKRASALTNSSTARFTAKRKLQEDAIDEKGQPASLWQTLMKTDNEEARGSIAKCSFAFDIDAQLDILEDFDTGIEDDQVE